jgi:hypothetical protein
MFDKQIRMLDLAKTLNHRRDTMSRAYGPIFQVAYVVKDLEAHIAHWTTTMGVGPFFRFPLPLEFEWLEVNGTRVAKDVDMYAGVALAYSGDLMIELIQPGSAPSTYRDFIESGQRGVHHLGTFTDDYDNQMAAVRAAGIGVALEGVLPLSRFAYVETDTHFPATMVEIIEPKPAMIELFDGIKAAGNNWDGTRPLREM